MLVAQRSAAEIPDILMLASERSAPGASASACASFGELLQGELPDARRFLVTLPIELRAHARFSVGAHLALRVVPESSWKTARFVEALLARYELPARGELELRSEIPRGKGLASSTADLVAAYRAVTNFYRVPVQTDVLESLLREIEPSDGVMYDGIVAYLHREARLHAHLSAVPPLVLVAVDEGGEVETLAHNQRPLEYSADDRAEYAALLARLGRALASGDMAAVGAVATRSARLNQRLQPKRLLDTVSDVANAVGAAGVVVAHSGTYLGILVDARRADRNAQADACVARLETLGLQPKLIRTETAHV